MNGFHKEVVILAIYTDKNRKKHYSVFNNIEEAKRGCPNGVYQQVPFYIEDESNFTDVEWKEFHIHQEKETHYPLMFKRILSVKNKGE